MARAELQWEDAAGTSRVAFAMIEDLSRSGAGIRLRQPLSVGAKLRVNWHKEQFSGTVRHCHREGMDYVLGIQRDTPGEENEVSDASPAESRAS
jgi:hypothetical protein